MMVYRRTELVLDNLAQRRMDILQGAIELVDLDGIDEFTVSRVAKFVDIAVGTIYLHFVNCDELKAALVAYCTQEDTAAIVEACQKEQEPMKRLALALRAFIKLYTSTRNLHPTLMGREGYRRAIVRTITDIIAEFHGTGNLVGSVCEMHALAMIGAVHSVLLSHSNPSRARLSALLEAVLRIAEVTPLTYQVRAKENA